jgi:hypothetical protein
VEARCGYKKMYLGSKKRAKEEKGNPQPCLLAFDWTVWHLETWGLGDKLLIV